MVLRSHKHLDRHDLLGRSAARGSFMIWTYNMKTIILTDSFVPDGALATEVYENGGRISLSSLLDTDPMNGAQR